MQADLIGLIIMELFLNWVEVFGLIINVSGLMLMISCHFGGEGENGYLIAS